MANRNRHKAVATWRDQLSEQIVDAAIRKVDEYRPLAGPRYSHCKPATLVEIRGLRPVSTQFERSAALSRRAQLEPESSRTIESAGEVRPLGRNRL